MIGKLRILALVVALSASAGFSALVVAAVVPDEVEPAVAAAAAEPAGDALTPAPAGDLLTPAFAPVASGPVASAITLPLCEDMHGNSCPVVNVIRRCWWVQAGEPTICKCQATNTWFCIGPG